MSEAARILEEREQLQEFPFPPMEAAEPSSSASDDSPPQRARPFPPFSRASTLTPPPGHAPRRAEQDRDYGRESSGAHSKPFSRLLSRDDTSDASRVRSALIRTADRLDEETRRADAAEQRVLDTLQKLRTAREETMLAQANAARANEEVRMHKMRLEEAQREIDRAQQIVDDLEQARLEAETDAARARTTARKFREERLIARAREEGRRKGFEEGLSRGRDIAFYQIQDQGGSQTYARPRVVVEDISDDDDNDGEEDDVVLQPRAPSQAASRAASRADTRAMRTPVPQQQLYSAPPRMSLSQGARRTPAVTDTAPIMAPPPRRTLVTPMSMFSPPHARPISTRPPSRADTRRPQRGPEPISPIPIHEPSPSVHHPPIDIPPDNWVPYVGNDSALSIPPPHEMTRPITPLSPVPPSPTISEPPPPPGKSYASSVQTSVRSRDYAYPSSTHLTAGHAGTYRTMSPQSRTSTNISQYDLLTQRQEFPRAQRNPQDALAGLHQVMSTPVPQSPRVSRSKTPGPSVRPSELRPPSRGAPSRQEFQPPRSKTPSSSESSDRKEGASRPRTPLDRIFTRRFRNRKSTSSGGVPEILVESPSTHGTTSRSSPHTASQPHLLSPEAPSQILPVLVDNQGFVPSQTPDQRELPPLPGFNLMTPGNDSASDLPPGFVMGSFTPSPSIEPMKIPSEPYARPASRHRRTPAPRYEAAPVPDHVVYPEAPGKTPYADSRPLTPSATPASPPARSRSRAGSLSNMLSPLSLRLRFGDR